MSCYLEVAEIDSSGHKTYKREINMDKGSKYISRLPGKIIPWNKYRINTQILCDIFLPSGFPDTVTSDYIKYQLFDSLQAFCSSIVGLLSSRAVLEGFGVGDENASSTKAVLLTVSQDVTGRLATILFAWKYGPALAPEAKMYRLSADFFNDIAFVLDCLSPVLPPHFRLASLCLAGAMRAVCGVCGGASKAALSMHFAKARNVGELNAKDASQETIIGLLGMLCGSYMLSIIVSRTETWIVLIILLMMHLGLNYLAVRVIVLHTLNRQRTTLVYYAYRLEGSVPSPPLISYLERIFEFPNIIRDFHTRKKIGSISFCADIGDLEVSISKAQISKNTWKEIFECFVKESYILLISAKKPYIVFICFKRKATSEDQLKAWISACELLQLLHAHDGLEKGNERRSQMDIMRDALDKVNSTFLKFLEKAKAKGWDLTTEAIVTKPIIAFDIALKEDVKIR